MEKMNIHQEALEIIESNKDVEIEKAWAELKSLREIKKIEMLHPSMRALLDRSGYLIDSDYVTTLKDKSLTGDVFNKVDEV